MGGSQLELFQQRDGQVRRVGAGREREDRWGGEGRERDENVRDGGIEGEAFAAAMGTISTPITILLLLWWQKNFRIPFAWSMIFFEGLYMYDI